MDKVLSNRLINEIGDLMLSSERYQADPWDGIALVVTLMPGSRSETGYIYEGENWKAQTPGLGRVLINKCAELQEAMRTPSGEVWKKILIHITRPGPEINVQFEYDDPERWALKKVSLDMSDYANSLRPPSKETAGN